MQQAQSVVRLTLMIAALVIQASCTGSSIPVIEKNNHAQVNRQHVPSNGTHTVKNGETLYSIAWLYGGDVKRLAAQNNIAAPYMIHPGERLRVGKGFARQEAKPQKTRTKALPAQRVATLSPQVAIKNISAKDRRNWRWPAQGELVRSFGQGGSGSKGIDIAGRAGQSVYTTRAGTVVYSGNGIRGYGNLLIVKHNAEFLSAYAYNSRLLVKEGDKVKDGQKIAEIGSSGVARTAKLHFEIRRSGKPVNPLSLLPRKG
ncbi:MAG: peptidoglycan DD-metalloendopeptidase family protein [Pseudomonadales bacterium]